MMLIMGFCLVFLVINDLQARITGRLFGFDNSLTNAFKNVIMFNNTGNIGLSLITLVFSTGVNLIGGKTPYLQEAQSVLIVVLIFSNITINTVGFYNAGRASLSFKDALKKILSMPTIYTIPIALFLQKSNTDPTGWIIWPALTYMKNALVPMALITLGVQLSKTTVAVKDRNVYLATFTRLITGPIFAILLISIFGFKGIVAQTLLISYSVPTAVNTALIAVEFKTHESFTTQVVVISTIVSAITLTFAIYISQIMYRI